MKQIGLYFGSFNPVHEAHIALAEYVLKHTDIEEIWFILSPQNPLKDKSVLWADETRLKLLKKALEGKESLKISTIEFDLPKPSYTINTLNALKKEYPDAEFTILMGADNWIDLDKWKNYTEILDNYKIIVYPRGNCKLDKPSNHSNVTFLTSAPLMPISSTDIRNNISESDFCG